MELRESFDARAEADKNSPQTTEEEEREESQEEMVEGILLVVEMEGNPVEENPVEEKEKADPA